MNNAIEKINQEHGCFFFLQGIIKEEILSSLSVITTDKKYFSS